MAPLPGGAGVGVKRQVFTMWPPARSMSITSDLVENALGQTPRQANAFGKPLLGPYNLRLELRSVFTY